MEGLLMLLYLCFYAFMVWCWVRIMRKAGFPTLGWMAIIPPFIFLLVILLAFKKWEE
jgi:lipopolysaccharide export LptBFGC system permease protein LptF